MRMWSTCGYATSILLVVAALLTGPAAHAQGSRDTMRRPADTAATVPDTTAQMPRMPRLLRISLDLARPIINLAQDGFDAYEAQAEYRIRPDLYAVVEGGFAKARYDYTDLSYTANSAFARIGIDKSLLPRQSDQDDDIITAGLRYGVAFINRSDGQYLITDSLFGNITGKVPAARLQAHWAEVCGGVKVELWHGLFAGWNIRGKFLLNSRALRELPPSYIAGYGRGEKGSIFDFSVWLGYALRWR